MSPQPTDEFWSDWPHNQAGLYWGLKDLCPYSTHCIWYCEEHIHPHSPSCNPAHQNCHQSKRLREKHVEEVYSQGPSLVLLMSTSHPTAFPYCTYHRAKKNGMMQCAIECFEVAGNYNSNFNPWVVCIHGRECIVITQNIPHFYPSQCGPVEAIPCPITSNWLLSSAMEMESIKNHAQQMEQSLAAIISGSVTSSQARG